MAALHEPVVFPGGHPVLKQKSSRFRVRYAEHEPCGEKFAERIEVGDYRAGVGSWHGEAAAHALVDDKNCRRHAATRPSRRKNTLPGQYGRLCNVLYGGDEGDQVLSGLVEPAK